MLTFRSIGEIIPVEKQYYQQLEVSNAFNKERVKELEQIIKFRKNEGKNNQLKNYIKNSKQKIDHNCKMVRRLYELRVVLKKESKKLQKLIYK